MRQYLSSSGWKFSWVFASLLLAGGGCELVLGSSDDGTSTGSSSGGAPSAGGGTPANATSATGGSVAANGSSIGGSSSTGLAASGGQGGEGGTKPNTVIYVEAGSPVGNEGLTPDEPMPNIQTAIDAAVAHQVPYDHVEVVRVCESDTLEPFTIKGPISVEGGYDCATFDEVTGRTTVASTAVQPGPAITVQGDGGAGITSSVVVSGFTVQGVLPHTTGRTVGILVTGGASPTIRKNTIDGGGGVLDNGSLNGLPCIASVGIEVDDTAAPNITDNTIRGGSGSVSNSSSCPAGRTIGSVGILYLGTKSVKISDNEKISGGTGTVNAAQSTDGTGSVGIALFGDKALVTGNPIDGGTGTALAAGNCGIDSAGNGEQVEHNTIFASAISKRDSTALRIRANSTAAGSFIGNRIYDVGGDSNGLWGVHLDPGSRGAILGNNLIYGSAFSQTTNTKQSIAIEVEGDSHVIAFNTVFTGFALGGSSGGPNASDLVIGQSTTGDPADLKVSSNIFFGSNAPAAIIANQSAPVDITTFDHNVVFGTPAAVSGDGKGFATFQSTNAYATANLQISNNCASIGATCEVVSTCAPTALASCGVSLFQWPTSPQDSGFTAFEAAGWQLNDVTPHCSLARGGSGALVNAIGQLTTDFADQPRPNSKPSAGAYQQSDSGCP